MMRLLSSRAKTIDIACVEDIGVSSVVDDDILRIHFPRTIHLNVGGSNFMTTLPTLRSHPDSVLGQMFSGNEPILRDVDGSFCIDRDGRLFQHILNYLRDGSVPVGLTHVQRLELLREAKWYRLDHLHSLLGGVLEPRDSAPAGDVAPAPGTHRDFWDTGAQPSYPRNPRREGRRLWEQEERLGGFDLLPQRRTTRVYARLRYGHEYPGKWIVSSPRSLPNVEYELYDAALARDMIPAMNKMAQAGFKPCKTPPEVPAVDDLRSDNWQVLMYKDIDWYSAFEATVSNKVAKANMSRNSTVSF